MTTLDTATLAEKIAAIERHLQRVEAKIPEGALSPMSDATDAVVLHLYQAVQVTIDLAVQACLHFKLGAPTDYGNAFVRLCDAQIIQPELRDRLVRAAGFRNVVAHAYERLDLVRVLQAAKQGPNDVRAFLQALSRRF